MRYDFNLDEKDALLQKKKLELAELELSSSKALLSIQTFHKQQHALFDDFVLLRQRYDDQKNNLLSILWVQCGTYHPDLQDIPKMENEETFVENEKQVGEYHKGKILGEGQYATVTTCWKAGAEQKELALKCIKKEKITTVASLKRVSNEISTLKQLNSKFVVSVIDSIHTTSVLYIVTEKGGADLFEFFDEHPDGVPEQWAVDIIGNILKAVSYCHNKGFCHRDLKPENILLSFDPDTKTCVDLKLCDFGLSSTFKPGVLLTEFCGSPGFFAPEMITSGSYYGDKVDVWSIGCIAFELILGHERFCDVWMSAYDYEVLQDKEKFTKEIKAAVEDLPNSLNFSSEMNDFISLALSLRVSQRPSTKGFFSHKLFEGEASINEPSLTSVSEDEYSGSYATSPSSSAMDRYHKEELALSLQNLVLEDRTRHMLEDENERGHHFHLPPIEPQTPNVSKARKLLHRDLVVSVDPGQPGSPRVHAENKREDKFNIPSFKQTSPSRGTPLNPVEEWESGIQAK